MGEPDDRADLTDVYYRACAWVADSALPLSTARSAYRLVEAEGHATYRDQVVGGVTVGPGPYG